MRLTQARHIASLFELQQPVEAFDFPSKGNINQQTYLIKAGPPAECTEYLLQLLNPNVFKQPRAVMRAMIACIQAQQSALSEGALPDSKEWETIRLVPTKEGRDYLEIPGKGNPRCWRMMARIRHAHTYKSLSEIPDASARLRAAEEVGRGLAIFGTLTAAMDASQFPSPLPGYRDTRLYYDQLLSICAGNRTYVEAAALLPDEPMVRRSTERYFLVHIPPKEYRRRMEDPQLARFLALALEQRHFALTLTRELQAGNLKTAIIHGDTKLDNFLFNSSTGKVKSLVDLDTIMPHTWLSDWGDMVRSLSNVAGEKEADLEKVRIDREIFKAAARGFLRSARFVALQEVELMADAPQIMALELGVRFLADYLRGDSYFKPGPADAPDLNKTRAIVQFCVFEDLRRHANELRRYIAGIR